MIDAGLDLEQALLAAEIFEAEMETPRSKEAERAARYREKKKLAGVALSSAYPEDSVTTVTTITTVVDETGGLEAAKEIPPAPPKENIPPIPLKGDTPPAKRATRLPQNFEPDDAGWALAIAELGSRMAVEAELVVFRDHWAGEGKAKLDWQATWRNWIRRAKRFNAGRGPPQPVGNPYLAMLRAEDRDATERHHASAETRPAPIGGPQTPSLDFEPDPLHPGRWEAVRTGM